MNLLYRIRGDMETPRLLLRHWNPLDLEDFLSFAADPEVMLASGATPAVTPAQGETAFRRALWDSGCYAIVLKETGRAIGKIKFQKDIRRFQVNALSTGNDRSRRVIEKCGFQYEGTIRRAFQRGDGQIFDDVCYSILKEEYFAYPERYKKPKQ